MRTLLLFLFYGVVMIFMYCAKAVATQRRRATPLRLMECTDTKDPQK
jgi:hypothetical protein